jgi:RND family efflux transporter MFP subunit
MSTPSSPSRPDLGSLRIDDGDRRGDRTGRRLWIALAALAALLLVAGALLLLRGGPPVVEAAAAQAGGAGPSALLNASGYVTPRRKATIASKVTGRVTGVFFDEGAHVRSGQVLATLDDSDARLALQSAQTARDATRATIADQEVQLANAERALGRAEQLAAGGAQSQEALENARTAAASARARLEIARAQVAAAEARVREARQGVDNCVIRAPFEGIAVSKDAQVGEMVSPVSAGGGFTRTGVATVVDMGSLEIEVDVNESYIARVVPEQPVRAILDAYPDWEIPGRVRTVIPSADRQKATVKVRIAFARLDPRILPDMGVKVTFLGEVPREKGAAAGVLVPQAAVRDDGRKFVLLVKGERVERRAVALDGTHGTDAMVTAGLSPGELVVVNGPADLRDGQAVTLRK